MRIVDLLNKDSILLGGAPTSKSEAIDMLIDLQVKGGNIADREAYKKGILAREAMSSTAVGEGIAIPHAKSEAVKAPSLAAMTVPGGVDYEAMDDEPSNLLFMIAAPNNGDVHLEVLSRLMTLLMDEDFRAKLLAGYIGKSIADRPGFLVGLVGGYLATTGSTFASVGGAMPSGFLGALLAGFAGGFIMLGLEKLCDKMPKALNGIKPVLIYPLAGLGIIAVVMCAINPFMGMINTGISDFLSNMGSSSKILLGAVLGAMMSIDMGGPFNKAAYVFGTAAIAAGNYDVMAAVMIGGMVPPIAIALSTTFFKNRWTEEERKSGPVNYIMGLSFVTEGAIPYAAADPLRVIPACMVGAGLAGGLSMAFNCTLMAPHGGIFVFAVVGNWAMYLAALAAGSIVGMLLLALLKKKKVSAKKK